MENKNNLQKHFTARLDNLFTDIKNISNYPDFTPSGKPNFWKNDEIKILRQTFAKFIADYGLQGGFIHASLKYQIEQL